MVYIPQSIFLHLLTSFIVEMRWYSLLLMALLSTSAFSRERNPRRKPQSSNRYPGTNGCPEGQELVCNIDFEE